MFDTGTALPQVATRSPMNHALDDQVTTSIKGDVVFVGRSAALDEARELALALGYGRAQTADAGVDCAVVDDDALDGICSPADALLLAQVRTLGVPVLTVSEARNRFRVGAPTLSLA
ncbi:hypothetical protein A5N78_15135 [Prescottella equi]|uniref:Uncharacterized protein n=2 Tax=Rhodococcus hoagii TaxID=43767 RepID=E9SX09_RHOHA|nr:hypothetical protein HMPREF0724_10659 [Prescottella equi ATCC 33707]MBP0079149.1 hypothetical protein [Prescottella equi]MBP0084193.1 hypothetical protein [Prescottella equi]MBP0086831.1 hypothetical protein [Prescottella equi]MBP0093275.1 hypothetical protein [Prescottella equi]